MLPEKPVFKNVNNVLHLLIDINQVYFAYFLNIKTYIDSSKSLLFKIGTNDLVASHKTGLECNCKRLKCFEIVKKEDRTFLLSYFDSLASKNGQDSF